jgi:hypothetical protein
MTDDSKHDSCPDPDKLTGPGGMTMRQVYEKVATSGASFIEFESYSAVRNPEPPVDVLRIGLSSPLHRTELTKLLYCFHHITLTRT